MTYVHPPQRSFFSQTLHFFLIQSPTSNDIIGGGPPPDNPLRFSVLSIRAVVTPDGIAYQSDPSKLLVASNPDLGDGFLYDEFKFSNPSDLALAMDETNYLFVLDAGKDSLFTFTSTGIEGVENSKLPGQKKSITILISMSRLNITVVFFSLTNTKLS